MKKMICRLGKGVFFFYSVYTWIKTTEKKEELECITLHCTANEPRHAKSTLVWSFGNNVPVIFHWNTRLIIHPTSTECRFTHTKLPVDTEALPSPGGGSDTPPVLITPQVPLYTHRNSHTVDISEVFTFQFQCNKHTHVMNICGLRGLANDRMCSFGQKSCKNLSTVQPKTNRNSEATRIGTEDYLSSINTKSVYKNTHMLFWRFHIANTMFVMVQNILVHYILSDRNSLLSKAKICYFLCHDKPLKKWH